MAETLEVWASKGHVMHRDSRGEIRSMTVQEAAKRARALNESVPSMPKWLQKGTLDLVEKVMQACLKAKRQSQEDKLSAAVVNAPAGLDAEGKISQLNSKHFDGLVASLCRDYRMVTEEEIVRLLRIEAVPVPLRVKQVEALNNARGGHGVETIVVNPSEGSPEAAPSDVPES